MSVSVVIPFDHYGDADRLRAYQWVRRRYAQYHPEWEIKVGSCFGEWSKGAALRNGVDRARGNVLVLADADSFVSVYALNEAVLRVSGGEPWVVPHKWVYRLSEQESENVYAGGEPQKRRMEGDRKRYVGPAGGGITVLSRDTWDTVGGVDPLFVGWGGEDLCFGWALMTLCPHPAADYRVGADLFHLYHERANPRGTLTKPRGSDEAEARLARYRKAWGHPEPMRELIAEWMSPIS